MGEIVSYTPCRTPACRTPKQPGYADRGLCLHHEQAGLDAITALPTQWSDLQSLIWDKPTSSGDTPGGHPGPSEPINYAADTLAREIEHWVIAWAEIVRDRAGLAEPHTTTRFAALTDAARTLTAHYSALLAVTVVDVRDPDREWTRLDGADGIVELTRLHSRSASMIGVTSPTTAVPGNCATCGKPTLRHRDGSDTVQCATCRASIPWDTYADQAAIIPVRRVA